jgi:photosystem II stability/assembly factor-like uncharacterized protein
MKTKLFYLSLVIILSFTAVSFSQWTYHTPQITYTRNITSIYFSSLNTGWIVGDSGLVYKTTNGGNNWISQSVPTIYTLWCIYALNDSTVWVCGSAGLIYKSVNGGDNWVNQISPSSDYLYKIRFTDALNGWIVTSGSRILNTTDGGNNWLVNYNSSLGGEINALATPSKDTILTAGQGGIVYRTTNHGVNWTFSQPGSAWLTNMNFPNRKTGWVCGRSGNIIKTTNAGINWTTQVSGTTLNLGSVFFVDTLTGYLAGNDLTIQKTTNGGTNWYTNANISGAFFFYTIFFHNALSGWAVGSSGTMMRTTSGGLVFAGNNGSEAPDKYALMQNYPNPFNPSTTIKFDVPKNGFVTLSVFKTLGKEIETLVSENLSAGKYEYKWDAARFSSGVYYCRMTTTEFTDVKRMMLVK